MSLEDGLRPTRRGDGRIRLRQQRHKTSQQEVEKEAQPEGLCRKAFQRPRLLSCSGGRPADDQQLRLSSRDIACPATKGTARGYARVPASACTKSP